MQTQDLTQLGPKLTRLPVAVVLRMLGSVFGTLHSSVQLLHCDFLTSQLVPLLQQICLKAMNLCSLVGKLSTELAYRVGLVIRAT